MRWFQRFFRRELTENKLDSELRFHLEQQIADYVAAGMTPEEAARRARSEFGGLEQAKEACRDVGTARSVETLIQDLRYGLRQLRRNPGFTLVAAFTLALGIGLNTSIFTVFDAATLRPLPVKDPNTVVDVYQSVRNDAGSYRPFSYPEYIALRELNSAFSGLVAYSWIPAELDTGPVDEATNNTPTQAHGLMVSGNYFSVLGGQALMGRAFARDEGQIPGAHPVLVLSHAFWQRHFKCDPSVVGRAIKVNGTRFIVVGIARQDFVGTEPQIPDFWAPLMMQAQLVPGGSLEDRGSFGLDVVARLKPGVSRKQAQASLNILISRISQDYLGTSKTASITLTPGSFFSRPDERGQVDSMAFLVLAAVGMVLLIACANVASLVLARASGRQREISIRLSLGASRGRLIRQLLTESALMALLGGVIGLLLAWHLPDFLIGLLTPPYEPPVALHLGLDIRVFAYTLVLSLLTGLVFGFAPALQASKPNLVSALKDEGSTFGLQLGPSHFRSLLVVVETAVCLVLVLAAGLLVRALERAQHVDPGFDTKHVLVVSLDLGFQGYDDTRAATFHAQLIDRLQDLPGVKSVSIASLVPLGGVSRAASIVVAGEETPASSPSLLWDYWVVSPNYFETLRIPILQGRSFSAPDARGGPPEAIINEAMARQVWPGENPLGKRFRLGPPSVPFTEVVGVVRDTRGARLWEADKPYVYLPLLLSAQGPPVQTEQLGMLFLIRVEGNPDIVAAMVPRVVKGLDPAVHPSCSTLEKSLGRWAWFSQVGAVLSSALGFLAILLAVVGLYGVVSYSVTQRMREMGIRVALGATHGDVLRLIIRQGLRLTFFGIGAGLVIALAATRVIAAMLYGVKTYDPATLAGVSLLMALVALAACYIPARRATRADPMVALRYE